jgi:hypothetical protein
MNADDKARGFRHPCATEREFRAIARGSALGLSQIVWLIQGFLPRGRSSDQDLTYLDEYADQVLRLKKAIKDSELILPVTPRQLVDVAACIQLSLPQPFVDEVIRSTPRSSRKPYSITETDELVHPPCRVGRPRSGELTSSSDQDPKRHGVTKIQGRDFEIEALARNLAFEYVRTYGEMPFAQTLVNKLSSQTGKSRESIRRCFSVRRLLSNEEYRKARIDWHKNRDAQG